MKFQVVVFSTNLKLLTFGGFTSQAACCVLVLLPGQKSCVCLHIIVCIEKISFNTESSVKSEVVSILKVVANKIFDIWIYHCINKVEVEYKFTLTYKKILYVCSSAAGCVGKKGIIGTLTD